MRCLWQDSISNSGCSGKCLALFQASCSEIEVWLRRQYPHVTRGVDVVGRLEMLLIHLKGIMRNTLVINGFAESLLRLRSH